MHKKSMNFEIKVNNVGRGETGRYRYTDRQSRSRSSQDGDEDEGEGEEKRYC